MSSNPDYIAVARILRPQGRRGEVLAEILTDFPEKFEQRRQLWLSAADGSSRREVALENSWLHKGHVVLKFAGVDSISQAEELKGMMAEIARGQQSPLDPGSAYIHDLVGSKMVDVSGGFSRELGIIEEVDPSAGTAPLLRVRSAKGEYEIPFAEEYLVRFDGERKLLEMKLPQGMLEINAPLTEEEKKEQNQKR